MPGSINEKIGEITKALSDQKGSLDTYLSLIEQAVKNGFIDSQKKQDLIEKAIKGLGDTVSVVTKKLQEAMSGSLSSFETKLETIGQAVTDGFAGATEALGWIKDAVDKAQKSIASADTSILSVTKALGDVIKAIKDTDTTITNEVAAALTKILDAIVAPPDYSTLLEQIKEAIENLDLGGGGNEPEDPYNGHEYVDLGMIINGKPVYWATCNVGATKPEEYGDYFAWGETEPKDSYQWSTYQFCEVINDEAFFIKYCNDSSYGKDGFTDDLTTLEPGDDAATANWKGKWRMPTYEEWEWLISTKEDEEIKENYEWTWCDGTTVKYNETSVAGWKIVRKSTSATLFLPAAGRRYESGQSHVGSFGYYWSSSLGTDDPYSARGVCFLSGGFGGAIYYRFSGNSVRPVAE